MTDITEALTDFVSPRQMTTKPFGSYIFGMLFGVITALAVTLYGMFNSIESLQTSGMIYIGLLLIGMMAFIIRYYLFGIDEGGDHTMIDNIWVTILGVFLCFIMMAAFGMILAPKMAFTWGVDYFMAFSDIQLNLGSNVFATLSIVQTLNILFQCAVGFGESAIFHVEGQELFEVKFGKGLGTIAGMAVMNALFMGEHIWRYGIETSIFTLAGGLALSATYIFFRNPTGTCLAHTFYNITLLMFGTT